MIQYTPAFYNALQNTSAPSASVVLPVVFDLVKPGRIVDVGCGNGSWLAAAVALGVDDVLGIDGQWIDDDALIIPLDKFRRVDLSRPFEIGEKFDLAISLEVAEHLPDSRAAGFVAELVLLSDVILFSAAVPGQGGENHVNEQWPDYWANLFSDHGYRAIDCLRWQLWEHPDVTWFYKQNLLMFASPKGLESHPQLAEKAEASSLSPHSVIRRELFERTLRAANPGVGRWVKMGKRMFIRFVTGQKNPFP